MVVRASEQVGELMVGEVKTGAAGIVETTVTGLGYELVDLEVSNRGRLMRIFIERQAARPDDPLSGVRVEDCELVSRQLQRVFTVEGIDYDRLEVSSPGLDRVLKKPEDFRKFAGQEADLRLRVPVAGRRRFTGTLLGVEGDAVRMQVEGDVHAFAMTDLEKVRLVPKVPGPGSRTA